MRVLASQRTSGGTARGRSLSTARTFANSWSAAMTDVTCSATNSSRSATVPSATQGANCASSFFRFAKITPSVRAYAAAMAAAFRVSTDLKNADPLAS
jgi:hypothetical protein